MGRRNHRGDPGDPPEGAYSALRELALVDHHPISEAFSVDGPLLASGDDSVWVVSARRTLEAARGGSRNLRFRDVIQLVESVGFTLVRISGSHHIFGHPDIPELVNLQDVHGQCKPYQARQVLQLVDRYNLKVDVES